jgi:hypothetical protein
MKLPAYVWSQHGPVPVELVEGLAESREALGMWDARQRAVSLDAASCGTTQLQVLMHEALHVALTDSGATNMLSTELEELVCDAVGCWLAAGIQAGWLKFGRSETAARAAVPPATRPRSRRAAGEPTTFST